jgi:hypothetical protein
VPTAFLSALVPRFAARQLQDHGGFWRSTVGRGQRRCPWCARLWILRSPHRLDGYTQANKASTRVVGRKGSVSGKRKGEGASAVSFSPLRRNTEQVTGTVVTGRMCNSWVAPLLLAAVQQSILGAASSTRQGAAAATLGEDEDAVSTVFPPSAARYGGSMAVSTSWAQHDATTGRSTGDVGAAVYPARRRRRGARPQLLGGDAGSRGPRASSVPPALPLPSPTSSLPDFWWRRWIWTGGQFPTGAAAGQGEPADWRGFKGRRG